MFPTLRGPIRFGSSVLAPLLTPFVNLDEERRKVHVGNSYLILWPYTSLLMFLILRGIEHRHETRQLLLIIMLYDRSPYILTELKIFVIPCLTLLPIKKEDILRLKYMYITYKE